MLTELTVMARRANRAGALRKASESTAAPACAAETRGRQSRFRLVGPQPRTVSRGESAIDGGEARRAISRARGGRRQGRHPAPADSYQKPGRLARCCGSRSPSAPAGPSRESAAERRRIRPPRRRWREPQPSESNGAPPERALPGDERALDVSEARRAGARSRGGRRRRRDSAHEKPGRVARRRDSRACGAPAGQSAEPRGGGRRNRLPRRSRSLEPRPEVVGSPRRVPPRALPGAEPRALDAGESRRAVPRARGGWRGSPGPRQRTRMRSSGASPDVSVRKLTARPRAHRAITRGRRRNRPPRRVAPAERRSAARWGFLFSTRPENRRTCGRLPSRRYPD